MIAAQRMEKIKAMLIENKNISIGKLTSNLNVSDVTIRKDLDKLQEEGFLIRTHGGAILKESTEESNEKNISIENYKEKEHVAELASKTIEEGDSIFLGSGATCYMLSKKINHKNITVVTNNINALNELVPKVEKVFLIGGEIVYKDHMISSSSEKVDEYFNGIFVNKAFTSVTGIDLMAGLTVNYMISSFIYKQIPHITKLWTLLIDDSKFDKIGLYRVAPIEAPNCVITNRIPDAYSQFFQERDIKVITKL